MGVIKRILHRDSTLSRPRHRNLFLDMEENIHIHYRDLRIELSRGEFEELVHTFSLQSAELLKIIHRNDYKDGKLPNANREDVRIWTESRLSCDVAYNASRFSLEECGDGFHFHYRNYKILIDQEDFKSIVNILKSIDVDGKYASSYHEVLELMEINDLDFVLGFDDAPGTILSLNVAEHHFSKACSILEYIGFVRQPDSPVHRFQGSELNVVITIDKKRSSSDFKQIRSYSGSMSLVDYLRSVRTDISPDELNRIKCQILDVYYSLSSGKMTSVELNPYLWLYAKDTESVIIPCKSTQGRLSKASYEEMYASWSEILRSLELHFVKPAKRVFSKPQQSVLWERINKYINDEIASRAAVDKIYVMGSSIRQQMGIYNAPFVHGKMAKVGSDVDILIEINTGREADIPGSWKLINNTSSNHCAVYHIAQLPIEGDIADFVVSYPNLPLVHHLVDAYVWFPSRGHLVEKDLFLKKFSAKCVYNRQKDGIIPRSEVEARIASSVSGMFSLQSVIVERLEVTTRNELYKVFSAEDVYILKLFKVSGNYSREKIYDHTRYERDLINGLVEREISTPPIIPAVSDDFMIEDAPALLFRRIHGAVLDRPEYPLEDAARVLAGMHQTQMDCPLPIEAQFFFDETCMIWLPQFHKFMAIKDLESNLTDAFTFLSPFVEKCNPGEYRSILYSGSPSVHCHGDVKPKNCMITTSGGITLFDFNNAFFGPRMADILDGAFEFFLAEKYPHLQDFARFERFIDAYAFHSPLTDGERSHLLDWVTLVGCIKFTKEVRVYLEDKSKKLRATRALAIAKFVQMCLSSKTLSSRS